jgi:hypothetical protein
MSLNMKLKNYKYLFYNFIKKALKLLKNQNNCNVQLERI